jgi:hypothetical protein
MQPEIALCSDNHLVISKSMFMRGLCPAKLIANMSIEENSKYAFVWLAERKEET